MYPSLWRNNNPNHVTRDNTRYQDKVFYYSILDPSLSYQDKILAYHAAINNDFQTGLPNGTNPRVYADSKKNDIYDPSWNEDMHGNESEYYIVAKKKDISQLVKQKTGIK